MTTCEPRAWHGTVYRHVPSESPFGPLDTRFAALSTESCWYRAGEPTLVLSSDPDLAIQEFARHIACDRDAALMTLYRPRRLFAIELRLHRVFDLTDAATIDALSIQGAPGCFAESGLARATAGFLRHVRNADGLVVPSFSAPEPDARWNLLVFLDRLVEPLEVAVERVTAGVTFQLDSERQAIDPGRPRQIAV